MTLETGTRLGPYEIVSPLGKGGMGEVYEARDTRLERKVAIKVLRAEWSGEARFKERLEREARKISQLQHPNVCTLHDVGSQHGVDYLVMEYLHGETVESRLEKGPLPIPEVLKIGSQIAEAIEAAHRRGVVHRDLKPGNVILTAAGAKVLDFGLARDATLPGQAVDTQVGTLAAAITEEGSFAGTLPYMAPEQLEGRAADARADIWALGCVLYEMATGERPFRGATRASLTTAIMSAEPEPVSRKRSIAPERLDWVVKRCLAKDPERRWHSARDVSIELDAIAGQSAAVSDATAAGTVPATAAVPATASRRSARWLWAAATGVVLSGGWWIASRNREPDLLLAGAETAAALPFETLSDDAEIRQLASGIPQEMSARWARSGWTLLTPSASVDGSADPCAAVRGQPVRVYHGSVGRFQSQVRVTAQLTACPEGNRLWGGTESYDAADLNAVQQKIARWVLSNSQGHLFLTSANDTLEEYLQRRTPVDNERGLALARDVWRDGRVSQVGATLRALLQQALVEGWSYHSSRTIEEMVDVAGVVLADTPQWGAAHLNFGFAALLSGDRQRALEALERSVEMQGADFPGSHAYLGVALALTDRPDDGIAAIDEAVRLSPPDDPQRFSWEQFRGAAHFAAGRYQEARDASQLALSFNTNDFGNTRANAYQLLAASLAHLGELKEARSALEQAVRLRPALTLEVAGRWHAASSAEHRERLLGGLRLAGLGEDGLVEVVPVARDE